MPGFESEGDLVTTAIKFGFKYLYNTRRSPKTRPGECTCSPSLLKTVKIQNRSLKLGTKKH